MKHAKLMAVIAGLFLAGTPLAFATTLADYPQPIISSTGTLQGIIVVGSDAKPSDVAGAIDIAARLGGETGTTTSTGTATISVNGKYKEVTINDEDLETKVTGSAASGSIKHSKVPYLLDTAISWNGSTYKVHEEIYLDGLNQIEKTPSTTVSNGSAYVAISGDGTDSGSVLCYRYVFDQSTPANSEPDTIKPLTITLLGNTPLTIAGWESNDLSVLAGYKATFTLDTTTQTMGPYTVSVHSWGDSSRNSTYYNIEKDGNSIVTDDALNEDSGSKSYVLGSETVKIQVLKQRKGIDIDGNAYWEQDIIVGNETTQDLTDINDGYFSGDSDNGGYKYIVSTSSASQITAGDYIEICPDFPTSNTHYLKYGETLDFADSYFQIGFPSWSTAASAFKTLTIEKDEAVDVYANASDSHFKIADNKPAIKISGAELSMGNSEEYSTLWFVLNTSMLTSDPDINLTTTHQGWVVAKDSSTGRLYNLTPLKNMTAMATDDAAQKDLFTEGYNLINITNDEITLKFMYLPVNTSMGNRSYIGINGTYDNINFTAELVNASGKVDFVNSSGIWLASEDSNINIAEYDNANNGAGNGPIGNGGVIVDKPSANFAGDKVVLKLPPERLKAYIAFGKDITTSSTASGSKTVTPITTAVAKLDTEVTAADRTNQNMIIVGGPCVNDLAKELLDEAWNVTDSCSEWTDSSSTHNIPSGQAMIKLFSDKFATGKSAILVAGTLAADTRSACNILQDYDSYALTGNEVTVTGETVTAVS